MKKRNAVIVMLLLVAVLATACVRTEQERTAGIIAPHKQTEVSHVTTIDAATAQEQMTASSGYVLLDVRTPEEFAENHIKGAILLPDYEIEARAAEVLPDKDTAIYIYCRSGRRSAASAAKLAEMGYKKIYDFGGIIDWPYETVRGDEGV